MTDWPHTRPCPRCSVKVLDQHPHDLVAHPEALRHPGRVPQKQRGELDKSQRTLGEV